MTTPQHVAAALHTAGFTHLVWVPDSHFGTWEAALTGSSLEPIRVTREGEAVGLAAGLMLGGARPLVVMQCTGFFEAGDAVRNVAYDLNLPLKLIVGVRSWQAARRGQTTDTCPRFAEPLVQAWGLPYRFFDPQTQTPEELSATLAGLAGEVRAAAVLWAE